MAVGPKFPSIAQLLDIADAFGLDMSPQQAETHRDLTGGAMVPPAGP